MNLSETRNLLERRGLHLRRDLGQNYLIDGARADQLVELAGVQPGDTVIEVGTGLGALTRAIAARAERVVTLEIDGGVVRALREEQLLPGSVELQHVDALKIDLKGLVGSSPRERTCLVANLPYSSATPLLREMLDHREVFRDWSVMVQREVAARLVAEVGSKDYGSFAVLHSVAARVERLTDVAANAFFPVPNVVSTFVRVVPHRDESSPPDNQELLRIERVVRAVFGQRRKTIANGLKAGGFGAEAAAALERVGIDARVRAERVGPEGLRSLAQALYDLGSFGSG
ncbi:MAG: 16S rRNA (adenine(1518)-N(6)/adenine(1519)-N(6))-dimethyltransferase RsmA [Myxococcota bacterium]|nr:16S rRNA (adenine(1518)-N(6)/adenine(1519)-N(6))-dimethyltransferase RsmA [Myxococcota bacterium]